MAKLARGSKYLIIERKSGKKVIVCHTSMSATWSLVTPLTRNPKCCVKHKSHIIKVMFLCAVARTHFNPSANSWWDRKLGIWPIGDWEPVKWRSKNRPKGMLVWKNKTVTKDVYRELLISQLILAILEKWPRRDRMLIPTATPLTVIRRLRLPSSNPSHCHTR